MGSCKEDPRGGSRGRCSACCWTKCRRCPEGRFAILRAGSDEIQTDYSVPAMPYGALYPILDACKCADFVLLVLSASTAIDPGSWGELCLRTLQSQGLPTVVVAVPTLHPDGATGVGGSKKAGAALKAANEVRKSLLSFASTSRLMWKRCMRLMIEQSVVLCCERSPLQHRSALLGGISAHGW